MLCGAQPTHLLSMFCPCIPCACSPICQFSTAHTTIHISNKMQNHSAVDIQSS
uniref:Uncharacterized protein n=1 Tax=Anguilla anguilla TaxID=7936 RepID=A0A0E9R283_ANGAN